jgi:hypothetical protein
MAVGERVRRSGIAADGAGFRCVDMRATRLAGRVRRMDTDAAKELKELR